MCFNFFWIFYDIGRWCRQGDIIYVEIMDIMKITIRNIRCIHIQKEYGWLRYVDDAIMFLNETQNNLKAAFDLVFHFSKYTGIRPNFGKTNAIWIGSKSWKSKSLCLYFKIQWIRTNEDSKALGINLTEISLI